MATRQELQQRHQQRQQALDRSSRSSPAKVKTAYLIGYNLVSALLWLTVLMRVVTHFPAVGTYGVFNATDSFARWTQTLALLEVVHSAAGIVRAPLATTLMQVSSRILLVWGIAHEYPGATATNPAFSTMLIAWSITEVVRYTYFVASLGGGVVPDWLTWLRYNTFFVLYPLGALSEALCIFAAIKPASERSPLIGYALYAILAIYAPGLYIMYTHMMAQRRRIMRGKQRAKEQ